MDRNENRTTTKCSSITCCDRVHLPSSCVPVHYVAALSTVWVCVCASEFISLFRADLASSLTMQSRIVTARSLRLLQTKYKTLCAATAAADTPKSHTFPHSLIQHIDCDYSKIMIMSSECTTVHVSTYYVVEFSFAASVGMIPKQPQNLWRMNFALDAHTTHTHTCPDARQNAQDLCGTLTHTVSNTIRICVGLPS